MNPIAKGAHDSAGVVAIDSGSHINAPVERPAKPVRSNRLLCVPSLRD